MKRLILVLILAIGIMNVSRAQKKAFDIYDLYKIKSVSGISVSPKGNALSLTIDASDLTKHRSEYNVWLLDQQDNSLKSISSDGQSGDATWSEDGDILFYTKYIEGKPQIFSYSISSGDSAQITAYPLGITNPVLSPDKKLIAFYADVYPELGADGDLNAEYIKKKESGPVSAHIADKLLFRHWTDYNDGRCRHLIIYNIEDSTYTDLTPGRQALLFSLGGDVLFAFSPDSEELCFVANTTKHPEANTNADLFVIPVKGGESINITEENKAWDGTPTYSPDGRFIAYRRQNTEGYESDFFQLALYDRQSKESKIITSGFPELIDSYKWSQDSKYIYFIAEEKGYQPLYRIDIENGTITKILAQRALSEFDIDTEGNVYYTYSTTGKPSALYRHSVKEAIKETSEGISPTAGGEVQLTFLNQQLEETVDIRPSESVYVLGADGDSVHVFIVKPHDFDPTKTYPLVINVHGGPQMQWMDSFRGDWQIYPGSGYVVAYPNPHGSTGYGSDFCRAISGDWGGKVYEDIMKVTDYLETLSYVDKERIGAMGWSYGGYMMNWIQGHTDRYKCLASMMGVYDLRSMWGSTEELWFPNFEMEGQPWNSALYEKWSPSAYIQNFSTPTLVLTGELDYRVPYTQSLQYFSALQTLDIPSRLIVFKYDGHWPSTLNSMPVYYNSHLEWFNKYLGGAPAPWDTEKMIDNQVEY